MSDQKLQNAYKAAEEKRRRAAQSSEDKRRHTAILGDRATIPLDFSATPLCASAIADPAVATHPLRQRENLLIDFDPIENPGTYAEDPIWKRYWKTEGIRLLNSDGSVITDQMEKFRVAFELGYMACRKIEGSKA